MTKKLLFLSALLFVLSMPSIVFSHNWVTADQITVSWDAVTCFVNGDPIPPDDVIEYSACLVRESDVERVDCFDIWFTEDTQLTITLATEGRYFVGLRTLRKDSSGELLCQSRVGWSDDPLIVKEGKTFGIIYYHFPKTPTGLCTGSYLNGGN